MAVVGQPAECDSKNAHPMEQGVSHKVEQNHSMLHKYRAAQHEAHIPPR